MYLYYIMKYQSCHLFDLFLNINKMTTKPSKFWNLKFNNNYHPQKTCSIPLCSSWHLAWLRNIFGYLRLGFPVQYSISLWSPSAVLYSHISDYLFFLLIFKALFLPWGHWTWRRFYLMAQKAEGPSLLLRSCFCRKQMYDLSFLTPLLQEGHSICLKNKTSLSNKIDAQFLCIDLFLDQRRIFALVAPSCGFTFLCCLDK